jgi:predicted dehydrogenase
MSDPARTNIVLIGCGAFAMQAHLPALAASRATTHLACVIDVVGREDEIRARCEAAGLPADVEYLGLPDDDPGALAAGSGLGALDRRLPLVDAVIISSSELSHKPYVEWAVRRGLPTLVDKPLSARAGWTRDVAQARGVLDDLHACLAQVGTVHPVMIAAQRRYQPSSRHIASWLNQVYRASGWPVTFIQCLTNDGLWHRTDDYARQPTYADGAGKLLHTGYHLLDQLPWLMRHCQDRDDPTAPVRRIVSAQLFATTFHPIDAAAVMRAPSHGRDRTLEGLGEINASLQVTFRDAHDHVLCIMQIAAMHEGLSLHQQPFHSDPAERARTANAGRTKQDVLTIYQGPIAAVWMRRIAKLGEHPGYVLGGRDHLELLCGANPLLQPGLPAVKRLDLAYEGCDSAATMEFLRALRPGASTAVASPARDHVIAVKLLAAAYESAVSRAPVDITFECGEWDLPPAAEQYVMENAIAESLRESQIGLP